MRYIYFLMFLFVACSKEDCCTVPPVPVQTPTTLTEKVVQIIVDGNSYVHGNGYRPFSEYLSKSLEIPVLNFGVGGQTTPQMLADQSTQIISKPGGKNFLCVIEGGNDLYYNGSVQNAFNNLKTYCQNAKGFEIIVYTNPPRYQKTEFGDSPEQFNEKINQLNELIRKEKFYSALIDIAKRPEFQNFDYYDKDKIHPNQQGQDLYGELTLQAVKNP